MWIQVDGSNGSHRWSHFRSLWASLTSCWREHSGKWINSEALAGSSELANWKVSDTSQTLEMNGTLGGGGITLRARVLLQSQYVTWDYVNKGKDFALVHSSTQNTINNVLPPESWWTLLPWGETTFPVVESLILRDFQKAFLVKRKHSSPLIFMTWILSWREGGYLVLNFLLFQMTLELSSYFSNK